MSESLRDQFLKLGLVTEKQAKKASQPKRAPSRHQPPPPPPEAVAAAQQAAAAKLARDQELNRQRELQAAAKARIAAIRQLIEQDRVAKPQSDDTYSFIHGGKVRRLPVTATMREQLNRGELGIVRCEGRFDYVPAATAEKIRERDERAVVRLGGAEAAVDENDPYKDFVVPDDLVW